MTLLVDVGNSRIKWCRMQDDNLGAIQAAAYAADDLQAWCETNLADGPRPGAVLVANVAGSGLAEELSAWCQRRWQLQPWFARTETRAGGVSNGYRDIRQLGVDRWLALIAARRITPGPVGVISCGTALTLDAMSAAGEHLGGVIAPGPDLMRDALNSATRGVRTEASPPAELALARSTAAGVVNGGLYASIGLIERLDADLRGQMGDDIQYLVTGGGAELLASHCRMDLRIVDDLVLRGLAWYAGRADER